MMTDVSEVIGRLLRISREQVTPSTELTRDQTVAIFMLLGYMPPKETPGVRWTVSLLYGVLQAAR